VGETEKLSVLGRFFDLWAEGVREIPSDLAHPGIEIVSPLASVRGTPYRGYDGLREWISDVEEQFESWEYKLDEVREGTDPDTVVGLGGIHLVGRGSGVAIDQPAAWLVRFAADGRVRRVEVYTDQQEGLKRAGL
jgi:ketosteroid isomerase-like protein